MEKHIRFGTYIKEASRHHIYLSYNALIPRLTADAAGNPLRQQAAKVRFRHIDIYRLIMPYIRRRLWDQIKAVLPLAVYLALFQLVILRQGVADYGLITGGLIAVILGLMLFMEGLKVGLMPFGERIGAILPGRCKLPAVLIIIFMLGVGVTFAEPAIGALQTAGAIVDVSSAPYLYILLNDWAAVLVTVVGIGVGLAAITGTLRFLYGWSLKPVIYATVIPTVGLSVHIMFDPELAKMLGLAWDCGAVTTGPVTVPLVLALGIGIAATAGKAHSSLSGFGIVTLASLFPILGVQLLALFLSVSMTPAEIVENVTSLAGDVSQLGWYQKTPWKETLMGLRAIVPLILFLYLVLRLVLAEQIKNRLLTAYGISLCVLGIIIFNIGLTYGLNHLGGQSGGLIPAAFTHIELIDNSPLYSFTMGLLIAFIFAWLLGFGATLAEPALNALGLTVENLTNGAFAKSLLMYAVSVGVGTGIGIGIMKIIFTIPIAWLLLPGYAIALVLTYFSTEEFVNIAWDSAGVTTGPVTVPLVLAMGLGFGDAVGAVEGFGILSMASIGPIISVMCTGLWVRWKVERRHRMSATEALA